VTAAALALACGAAEQRVAARFGDAATSRGRRYAHGGLVPVMASYCESQHADVPRDAVELVEAVTNLDREIVRGTEGIARARVRAGASGTFALATALAGEVLLRAAYDASSTVARAIAATAEVTSFRDIPSVSLEHTAPFARVAPDGRLPVAGLSDDRRGTTKLGTSGVALLIPRQVLVDDNLGVMATIFADLGRRAALAVDHELFERAVMETADSFYSTANLNRTSSAALSASTLGAAEALLWNQLDRHKRPIGVRPRTLLLPPALSHTARALLASQPAGNNQLQVIVSPLLSLDGMPGASATTWYVVSDPNTLPAYKVTVLSGHPAPTITAEPMNAEGVRLRCHFDFGAGAVDPRAAAKVSA
jgi:hypothetical protein